MNSIGLPSNQTLEEFSAAVPWHEVERQKRAFNRALEELRACDGEPTPEYFAQATGADVTFYDSSHLPDGADVIMGHFGGKSFILGSVVSKRYRAGKSLAQSIAPYNLNPGVNHTNIHETEDSSTRIRALGAELELGLIHRDGMPPTEDEVQEYIGHYQSHARRLGITPHVDREACQYQVEVHVAPGVGYHRTRGAIDGIMMALVAASDATELVTAVMSNYPTLSDFKLTENPKVRTAVDLMEETNRLFPEYIERQRVAKERYHMDPDANFVEVFRLQGCHIHLDLAGRSEALGLLSFFTLLRSASAVANSAVLKGGPFVNGTCDPELLCAREYLRSTTVTGRTIASPLSPHLRDGDLARYAELLTTERANAVARALLYDDTLGKPISAMHSILGRLRPDLDNSRRICTLESTGMPVNISASRQAGVLADFEFTHTLVEGYFRKYGCNLEPMQEDRDLWSLVGPLDLTTFESLHAQSDRVCTDLILKTATGDEMTLAEFYEMKRIYMHKHLADLARITPRDIDDVYSSLQRMLNPPSGQSAETIEQYIYDHKLRSTGNWGRILRNAFEEEGGVPGAHNPDAVLRIVNRIHEALRIRYA